MGWLATRWEGTYEGCSVAVARNELTRGFKLEWNGHEIAHRTWSWIGLGELHATAELGERTVDVKVAIEWGGLNGKCTVTVDGTPVTLALVK